MKIVIIALILIVNLILAYIGDITYLMYLAGIYLMLTIILKLEKIIFNKQDIRKKIYHLMNI